MKQVIVYVDGGLVQDVEVPEGVEVIVRDYDVEGSNSPESIETDERGEYIESAWYSPEG